MQLKNVYESLEKSKEFLSWRKDHKESYLAHVFRLFDEPNKDIWQFGYYNSDDKISTFICEGESVKEVPEQNIFKKDNISVPRLDMGTVRIDFVEALAKAEELRTSKYPQHPILKSFAILQTIENQQVYNITYVTKTFNTINLRIGSADGEVKREKITSLMEMAAFEKGGRNDKNKNYIG
jgi:hypothetical protein